MKKVLITGGAGFIGSHIVDALLNLNYYVRVVDNLFSGSMININHHLSNPNFEFILGDINNYDVCMNVCKNIDMICHQAAVGSVPRSVKDPLFSHNSNVNGFLNILLCAKENNIKRIVYASSSSVYGDNPILPKVEDNIGNPLSPYALTKSINEQYAVLFTKIYGLECIGLRYFNVFGSRQNPNGAYAAVIPKFIHNIINNINSTINGDGTFSRDFTYVSNVVDANIKALLTDNNEAFGNSFNIGAGGRITILDMYNVIKKALNSNIEPIFGKNRDGDIPHSNASIEKSQKILNYIPHVSFEEGIHKTIESFINLNLD